MNLPVEIRCLRKSDRRGDFSCGNIELDRFFHLYAGQNQFKHHIGVTYVAEIDQSIAGFITLASGEISIAKIPEKLKKKLPDYPLPILRIARLAVDTNYTGFGLGRLLLKSVFQMAIDQKNKTGCVGVVVDAKKESVAFYQKLGFIRPKTDKGELFSHPVSCPMFLAINLIESSKKQP